MKAISASNLLVLNTAERSRIMTKRISGRSNGELRKVSFPSLIVFKTKKIKNAATPRQRAICLGRTKASVVMLKKRRGRARRRSPITKRLMFSKYKEIALILFISDNILTLAKIIK